MSIKEKALQLKQDFDDVHEAGKQKVISQSKYISKTTTGKVISLTDVSEVAHKVKVYGDNQAVEVLDNFLRQPYHQNKLTSGGVTWTVNDDGTVSAVGTSTAVSNFQMATNLPLESRKTYTFGTGSTNILVLVTYTVDGSTKYLTTTSAEANLAWGDGYELVSFGIRVLAGVTVDEVVCPVIYESGTKQTITATPTGTEINSMCPNMNFIADTDITVDYYSSFGRAEKELAMWNALTNYGTREVYSSAFAYADYSGYTIPKGLCKPRQTIGSMFYVYQGVELPKGVDCSEFNVSTTTQSYHPYNTFAYSPKLKRVYDIGIPANVMIYGGTYRACSALETIEIIRSAENTTFDANCFNGCSKLTHVIFSGVIASDINLQWSKLLDEESLVSLAVTAKDLFMSEEPFTKTMTLSEESKAILSNTVYPDTQQYAQDGASCMRVLTERKGWNIE